MFNCNSCRSRSVQHNFQIVVITHDEEFVQLLCQGQSGSSRPEFYYLVDREISTKGDSYSAIYRQDTN